MEGNENIIYDFKLVPENPNFKFEKYINAKNDYSSGYNGIFDIFTYSKDKDQYIITPVLSTFLIYIIRITDGYILTSLKGHTECLNCINYFQNDKNKKEEYILSVDIKGIIIIWEINNNFKIKFKINTKESVIYSSIIIFNPINKDNKRNKDNYIITSNNCNSENELLNYSKIYSLSNGKFIKNLTNTNSKKTYYILPWYDKKNNILYEIECCYERIVIINIEENKLYHEFLSEGHTETFTCGLVYNKNNGAYLCSLSLHGMLKFWDLENKRFIVKIRTGGLNSRVIIQWSEKYIILSDSKSNDINKTFKILDLDNFKIISNIGGRHKSPITCIKKISHCKYGNIIITGETGKSLIVWSLI